MARRSTVACGMYAFSPALQAAWRQLFSRLPPRLSSRTLSANGLSSGNAEGGINVLFRADDAIYQRPDLLLGHACGYPYLKKWRATHGPVCAPLFAVDGCHHTQYSSWFIAARDSAMTDLESARGKRAAVNNLLSNSGMNVLRHAVAELGGAGYSGGMSFSSGSNGWGFFSEVMVSGSHLASMDMVAHGQADVAAIDAVTYALGMAHGAESLERVRIIGQSAHTTSPCFMAPNGGMDHGERGAIIEALNAALSGMHDDDRKTLKLSGFQAVSDADYGCIEALESAALATVGARPPDR